MRPYVELTTEAVARAVTAKQGRRAKLTVIIDGLNQAEVRRVGTGLRQRGLHVRKVRGLRDESDAILRLADAMAGFLRDLTEGCPYAQQLYAQLQLGSVMLQA